MSRLFWKFFIVFWLALLVAGISVGTVVWLHHKSIQDQANKTDSEIDVHAHAFVSVAADIFSYGGEEALITFLQKAQQAPFPKVYAIDDNGNDILRRSIDPKKVAYAKALFLQGEFPLAIRYVTDNEGHSLLLFSPIKTGISETLFIGPPNERHEFGPAPMLNEPFPAPSFETRRLPPPADETVPYPLMLLIGSGLIAAIFFSALLAWYFTKPIGLLRQSFARLAEGELQTRIGNKMGRRHDELVELGKNFDDMAGKIGHLMSAQQRLLHDVSHELRSPLARMQAAIGIAEQQPEKAHEILTRIERESQRMSDLVGELLVLSRLETGVTDNAQTEICLNDLLDEIISDARFEASSKNIQVHYTAIEDIFITVRSELIHRAIENIVRNAIKFSPVDSEVNLTVSTNSAKDRLLIAIEDSGPGVAETDLESIFKPFFRGHLTERNDSIGLGLAIAYRAIDSHGGEIKASNREEGGLRVEVSLPYKQ
ncbi:sensor histidine kinase [Methylophaga sulfidovorans]|uniref:histidine kinase n=1 Tax=Methylophaga sulfidovorans TaxID=45496 RepID=A0A1I3YIN2_9GAMM|nr:ATP-binding protein [Methylophaga sulfidovorans]SFK31777.1 two-component system, OmpR family, sensor kinase [Methylophaga sulfidovorans]